MKAFFAILGTIITVSIGYYQYFYDHELKWKDLRYKEAKVVYQDLLRQTAFLSEYSKNEEFEVKLFEDKLHKLDLFLSSDFMLYKGDMVHMKALNLFIQYRNCLKTKKNDPKSSCNTGKLNGYQYRLSICSRLSLDHIREVPDTTIPANIDEIVERVVKNEHVDELKSDCKF
jgi:hypothetical protein